MFPAATTGGGMCIATVPDVCKVPAPPAPAPIPTPFPNMGSCARATGTSSRVKIQNRPVIHKDSKIPQSNGDEPGVLKGLISSTQMDKVTFRTGVAKVKVEGHDAVNLMKPTAHNGTNANAPVGMHSVPSQQKVLILG